MKFQKKENKAQKQGKRDLFKPLSKRKSGSKTKNDDIA